METNLGLQNGTFSEGIKLNTGAEPTGEAVKAATATVGFVKKNRNRGNIRKRPNDEEAAVDGAVDEEDSTQVVRKAKIVRGDPLAFSSKTEGAEEVQVTFDSNKVIQSGKDQTVFRTLETETETDRDGRALREQVLKQATDGVQNDGTYKGTNAYIDYRAGFRREHSVAADKGTGAHGPLRANMYVRTTALMDYNPCICKDYKETGFCSYGDSCKFMHDRGDYKQSWELDREWEEEQKRKRDEAMRRLEVGEDDEEGGEGREAEDDDLPFACYICRLPWGEAKHPVVTKCKHYFCEACALKHQAKSAKCAVCEQPTQGIFNVAQDIIKRAKKSGVKI